MVSTWAPTFQCLDLPIQVPTRFMYSSVGALQDEAAIRGCIRLADCMLQALGPDWFAMLRA